MCWASPDVVRFDLEPLLQGKMRTTKPKSDCNSLINDPRGLQCETNLKEINDWESFGVFRFDLGPLLQCEIKKHELAIFCCGQI